MSENKSKKKNSLVIRRDDYKTLLSYVKGGANQQAFDPKNAQDLEAELKRAKVVSEKDFPPDVVRINSRVRIRQDDNGKEMEFVLVTPEKADIKQKRISVMAPMGTALIGFSKGQQVSWEVPSGTRQFTILEVWNEEEPAAMAVEEQEMRE